VTALLLVTQQSLPHQIESHAMRAMHPTPTSLTSLFTSALSSALPSFALRLLGWAGLALLSACASAPPALPPITAPDATSAAPLERPTAAPSLAAARPTDYLWSDPLAATARKLRGELPSESANIGPSSDHRLAISLDGDALFAPGRSALKPSATPWLDRIAAALRGLPRGDVQIIGDPDPQSRDDPKSRALALDRAEAARDWLVARGLPAQRIAVAGRRPVAQGAARGSPQPAAAVSEHRLNILIGERAVGSR
jgi:outer membrane protein OmpA-like peptidoglycan-associated protein